MTGWFIALTAVWLTGFVMGSIFERLLSETDDIDDDGDARP